jgi:hypothetical protein
VGGGRCRSTTRRSTRSTRLGRTSPSDPPRPGLLAELFRTAGFEEIEEATLIARVEHPTFDEWWAPFELGVGPIADVFAELGPERVAQLRELCREALPPAPFTVEARAWAVSAQA